MQNLIGLTLPQIGLTRLLPVTAVEYCGFKVMAMESETKTNAVAARNGGGRAFHSRVEPFVAIIRAQRQQRKTWREIAEWLAVEEGCRITLQGLHQFYRRYPERFAQEALGHNSKAVHRAYSRRAQVKLPSLESYERQAANGRIIQMPQFDPAMH